MGHLRIKKVNALFNKDGSLRVKKRINWNQSNIKKAEIIARGGTPFKVLEREGRVITKTNGGEMWYCYFENEWDYMWHWYKGECFNLNSPYYKFKPTIHNNTSRKEDSRMGNVNKLKQLVTSNSPLLENFTEKIIERKKVA
jgi:hypothetical protein